MNSRYPLSPPPELTAKLWKEASAGREDAPIGEIFSHGVQLAYAAGADEQLKTLLTWLRVHHLDSLATDLLAACRPEPPSLKLRIAEAIAKGDKHNALSLLDEALPDA